MTQQMAILQELAQRLKALTPPAQPAQDADYVPEDLAFNWDLLMVPSDTNFPVPCIGKVQQIAAGLLNRLPFLRGRDLHDARFVLQMTGMWKDLQDEDRKRIFQRLNVYAIVAQVGWPTAIAACTANPAAANYYLPPGVQVAANHSRRRQDQGGQRKSWRQVQQQQQPAQAPASGPNRSRRRRI